MTASSRRNWQVFFLVTLLSGTLSVAWILTHPFSDEIIRQPIRHTAQISFALYCIILVARPLQQILRSGWTAKLLRNRRQLGVALAAAMTVHLGLLAYRFGSQPELTYPILNLIIGGGAYLVMYLMLITSFNGPTRALGPRRWKLLHRIGMLYMALIFCVPRSIEHAMTWDYWKFGIPFVIALIVRITAWQLSRRRGTRHSPA